MFPIAAPYANFVVIMKIYIKFTAHIVLTIRTDLPIEYVLDLYEY